MATIGGILVGMVGTLFLLENGLSPALHAPATGFSPIWVPAILWTIGFLLCFYFFCPLCISGKIAENADVAIIGDQL